MKGYLKSLVTFGVMSFLLINVCSVDGKGPLVSEIGNKHNLSSIGRNPGTTTLVDNTNPYRAVGSLADVTNNVAGRQVCIFCHTPHNANVENQAPLWNRAFSTVTNFQRYSSSTLQIRVNSPARTASGYLGGTPGAQPDGSSKLCLSCHDGVSSLGAVLRGGPITMKAGYDKITGLASFNPSTNKMKFGHHPVSFIYNAAVRDSINTAKTPIVYKLPSDAIAVPEVKLDRYFKMQCSTCHDPHQNQSDDNSCYDSGGQVTTPCNTTDTSRKVVPFWVFHAGSNSSTVDHDTVCTACHPLDALPGSGMFTPAAPSPPNTAPWPKTP